MEYLPPGARGGRERAPRVDPDEEEEEETEEEEEEEIAFRIDRVILTVY